MSSEALEPPEPPESPKSPKAPESPGSRARDAGPDDLPSAWAAMSRLCRIGLQHEPRLLVFAFVATVVAAVPDALIALWLTVLADGVLGGRSAEVSFAVVAMAISVTLTWLLRVLTDRITRRFRDRITVALEAHVAGLQATISGLEHHERPDIQDRLAVLRQQIFVLDHMYMSMLGTVGWIIRLGLTLALLASVHPALTLLALFAVPSVLTSLHRPAVERRVEESVAEHQRRAEHLFATATTPAAGKEVRVTGIQSALATRRRDEWERWFAPVAAARRRTAVDQSLAWSVFGLGYVLAIVAVAVWLRGSVGQVLLILAAGARLSAYVSQTVGEIGFLRGVWLDGSQRLVWLERYAAAQIAGADRPAPEAIRRGIEFDDVSFRYPGTDRSALEHVSVTIPAGSVVAIVGENGAGKSTLVKLLAQFYRPTSGVIRVDDLDLTSIDHQSWRTRLAGAFQDFFRFEFSARRSIGLGDLTSDDDTPIRAAITRAGATAVIDEFADGLDTQLGATWPQGRELSYGQWQRVALARGFMRPAPLLLVLDEPTSALDAEAEHALFERYATAARDAAVGGITILVSHRFSTVGMADLILVLDGSRLAEFGSHADLMGRGGTYAELFSIQARAYR